MPTVIVIVADFVTAELLSLACNVNLYVPAGILAKIHVHEVETGRYEYQVLLDETVDINELASHYDIIGQDGLIWTIQDKEN